MVSNKKWMQSNCVLKPLLLPQVLLSMLQSDCRENEDRTIELPEFEPPIVQAFLRLCYCGTASVMLDMLPALFTLCHLYQAHHLMDAVAAEMVMHLDHSNALPLYNLGHMYSSTTIKEKALRYIQRQVPCGVVCRGLGDLVWCVVWCVMWCGVVWCGVLVIELLCCAVQRSAM